MATHYNLIIFTFLCHQHSPDMIVYYLLDFIVGGIFESEYKLCTNRTQTEWNLITFYQFDNQIDALYSVCSLFWFTDLTFFRMNMIRMRKNITENIRCQLKYEFDFRMINTFCQIYQRFPNRMRRVLICYVIRDLWMLSAITISNILNIEVHTCFIIISYRRDLARSMSQPNKHDSHHSWMHAEMCICVLF